MRLSAPRIIRRLPQTWSGLSMRAWLLMIPVTRAVGASVKCLPRQWIAFYAGAARPNDDRTTRWPSVRGDQRSRGGYPVTFAKGASVPFPMKYISAGALVFDEQG